jgi:general secretion pathway protein K
MRGERGFALVITLIVTALLVALLAEFVNEVYVDTSHSHNFVASQQAGILAESGIAGGIQLLQLSKVQRQSSSYTSFHDLWAKPIFYDTGVGTVTISIEEESGKLDLNTATSQTGTPAPFFKETAEHLLDVLKLPPELYEVLADWVDKEPATPRTNGAETSYYSRLKPPYQAHDDRLDTVEELALLKGFTPEVLTKLRSCVTVYGYIPGVVQQPAININTAPKELLLALDKKMTSSLVDEILEYRKIKPIKNLSDIAALGNLAQSLQGVVVCKGTIYRIRAEGKVGESVSVAEAVVTGIDNTKPTVLYWREY